MGNSTSEDKNTNAHGQVDGTSNDENNEYEEVRITVESNHERSTPESQAETSGLAGTRKDEVPMESQPQHQPETPQPDTIDDQYEQDETDSSFTNDDSGDEVAQLQVKFQVVIPSLCNFNPQNQLFLLLYDEDDKSKNEKMETCPFQRSGAYLATKTLKFDNRVNELQSLNYAYAIKSLDRVQGSLEAPVEGPRGTSKKGFSRYIDLRKLQQRSFHLQNDILAIVGDASKDVPPQDQIKEIFWRLSPLNDRREDFETAMGEIAFSFAHKDVREEQLLFEQKGQKESLEDFKYATETLDNYLRYFVRKTNCDGQQIRNRCALQYLKMRILSLSVSHANIESSEPHGKNERRLKLLAAILALLQAFHAELPNISKLLNDEKLIFERFCDLFLIIDPHDGLPATEEYRNSVARWFRQQLTADQARLTKHALLTMFGSSRNQVCCMYLLPVYHYVDELISEYNRDEATNQVQAADNRQNVQKYLTHQREKLSEEALKELFEKLRFSFQLDPLLPRSFVALLSNSALPYFAKEEAIPIEEIMYAVNDWLVKASKTQNSSDCRELMINCRNAVITRTGDPERLRQAINEKNAPVLATICADMLVPLTSIYFNRNNSPEDFVKRISVEQAELLLDVMSVVKSVVTSSIALGNAAPRLTEAIKVLMTSIVNLLAQTIHTGYLDVDSRLPLDLFLKMYLKLQDFGIDGGLMASRLAKKFSELFSRLKWHEKINMYMELDQSNWPNEIRESVENKCIKAFNSASQNDLQVLINIMQNYNYRNAAKRSKLVLLLFSKSHLVENFFKILSYPAVFDLLQLNLGRIDGLTVSAEECLEHFRKNLELFMHSIISGSILAKDMQLIEKRTDFVHLIAQASRLMLADNPQAIDELYINYPIRRNQLAEFEEQTKRVKQFVDCFERFENVVGQLRSQLSADWRSQPLNNLCEAQQITSPGAAPATRNHKVEYKVLWYNLQKQDDEEILRPFSEYNGSYLMYRSIRDSIDDRGTLQITLSEFRQLFQQSIGRVIEKVQQLCEKTIRFSELQVLFPSEQFGSPPNLQKVTSELQLLLRNNKKSEQAVQSIASAFECAESIKAGQAVLRLCKAYALGQRQSEDGYAMPAYINLEMDLDNASLSEMIHTFSTTNAETNVRLLRKLNPQYVDCLNAFAEAKELVDWIVENIGTAVHFRTLIDLAQNSAGEGDAEQGKVECIERAVNGFEALIFSLRNTSGKLQSLHALLETCQPIWKNVDTDASLADKLREATRFKDWLATVKDTHSSVEMTALEQAKQLLSNGVFVLGVLQRVDQASHTDAKSNRLTLDDVLSASIRTDRYSTQKNSGAEKRQYSYSELRDLVDKLVLIAGNRYDKIKLENVQQLMLLFSNLEAQAHEYIALCQQGSLLFDSLKVSYFCNPNAKPSCTVDIGLQSQFTTSNDAPVECMRKLTATLRQCMSEWQKYVDAKRDKYSELNHFTMQQLVILRSDLSKLSSEETFDERVFDLVTAVATDLDDEKLLRDVVKMAVTKELEETRPREAPISVPTNLQQDKVVSVSQPVVVHKADRSPRTVIVVESKNNEVVRKATGRNCCCSSLNTIFGRSRKFESEESDLYHELYIVTEPNNDSNAYQTEHARTENMDQDINDVIHIAASSATDKRSPTETNDTDMYSTIADLWTNYLDDANAHAHMRRCFSFDSLAKILQRIRTETRPNMANTNAAQVNSVQLPLEWLKPNIIVTNERDMLVTYLGMYAYTKGDVQTSRFPMAEEVLVCSSETSSEQLELLWRRALQLDTQNEQQTETKLYCALYADRVRINVITQVEEKLKKLMRTANVKLQSEGGRRGRLVLLLSREHEDQSAFMSTFDCHRLDVKSLQSIVGGEAEVCKYIKRNAVVRDTQVKVVDAECCTLRVLRSSRAGMGKSLYVKRCTESLIRAIYGTRPEQSDMERHKVVVAAHSRQMQADAILQTLLAHDANYRTRKTTAIPRNVEKLRRMARIIHVDISQNVQENVDAVLFQLLIVGRLSGSNGYVWLKRKHDVFLVENVPLYQRTAPGDATRSRIAVSASGLALKQTESLVGRTAVHRLLELLPRVECRSPNETLQKLNDNDAVQSGFRTDFYEQLVDRQLFESTEYRKPAAYLRLLTAEATKQHNAYSRQQVQAEVQQMNSRDLLRVVLTKCGLDNPSWSEINAFLSFLNTQLEAFEQNSFCSEATLQDLPGFREFVVRLLVQMSRDFATRSLNIAEETPAVGKVEEDTGHTLLQEFSLKRKWESSAHPYLFFNADGHSFTFLGFNLRNSTLKQSMDLIDTSTNSVLEPNIMQSNLYVCLLQNNVHFNEDFDALKREDKLMKMGKVMSELPLRDADASYELTTDNVKKLLAIYMRLKSNIPVIIMGETGCGKTRMIKFLCDSLLPQKLVGNQKNLFVVKVHGGITEQQIRRVISAADSKAEQNAKHDIDTYLFLDEVNSSEAVGSVKQVMCDRRVGRRTLHKRLKIICACNPYRKHSDEVIKRLEKVGLGYRVRAEDATDRFGQIAMRQLVYRVKPLPLSLVPFCWDFGQLSTDVERLYIRQLVIREFSMQSYRSLKTFSEEVCSALHRAQVFMREHLQDECFFVSLRDVERALFVFKWFYDRRKDFAPKNRTTVTESTQLSANQRLTSTSANGSFELHAAARSLILALSVCYYASLQSKRLDFVRFVVTEFRGPLVLVPTEANQKVQNAAAVTDQAVKQFVSTFESCQKAILEECLGSIPAGIAFNQALRENVFMMIVCIELRIPLFLVGKPGSSKSLAKQIVHDSLQGDQSRSPLFKKFKKITMVSYQCSPLSTADGIIGTFRQAARFQKDKDLERFASVVVLDEIGLAEDSDNMPLKTLHALLETGVAGFDNEKNDDDQTEVQFSWKIDSDQQAYKRVAFIGISNWALDPAKTNRGILLQRCDVGWEELVETAYGIWGDANLQEPLKTLTTLLSKGFAELSECLNKRKEFFGLRDFYSLIKMVAQFAGANHFHATIAQQARMSKHESRLQMLTWPEIQYCIQRNFDGLDAKIVEPLEIFAKHLRNSDLNGILNIPNKIPSNDNYGPDCSTLGVVKSALQRTLGQQQMRFESRYLLLLTENFAALRLLLHYKELGSNKQVVTIFGSKFPDDVKYTQICSNINHIKMGMQVGSTVIVLNLPEVYESLYDAMNQYYSYIGQDRYVDLGLGTQRVKCKVHEDFNLIVLAHEQTVLETFPIPLINRLEKHKFSLDNVLVDELAKARERVAKWCEEQVKKVSDESKKSRTVGDVFVGFTEETAAYMVLNESSEPRSGRVNVSLQFGFEAEAETIAIADECCRKLRQCMPLDIVMRLGDDQLLHQYWYEEGHRSLKDMLQHMLRNSEAQRSDLFLHVSTFSHVMTESNLEQLSRALFGQEATGQSIRVCTLQQFESLQKFSKFIEVYMEEGDEELLVVQCDRAQANIELIECAQYAIEDVYAKLGGNSPYRAANEPNSMHDEMAITSDDGATHAPAATAIKRRRSKRIRVVLLLYLIRNSRQRFSGFPCGIWTSVHLDELFAHSLSDTNADVVNDIIKLQGRSFSALLEDFEQAELTHSDELSANERTLERPAVNVLELIRQCIPEAMSMLRYNFTEERAEAIKLRSAALIRALSDVFAMTGNSDTVKEFQAIFVSRLRQLAHQSRENRKLANEKPMTVLFNDNLLAMCGTYQQAVIYDLKCRIKPLMGALIAYLDSQGDFDVVLTQIIRGMPDKPEVYGLSKLWLALLKQDEVSKFDYTDALALANVHTGVLSENGIFLLRDTVSVPANANFPFGKLIYNRLQQLAILSADVAQQQVSRTEELLIRQAVELYRTFSDTTEYRVMKSVIIQADSFIYDRYSQFYVAAVHQVDNDKERKVFVRIFDVAVRLLEAQVLKASDDSQFGQQVASESDAELLRVALLHALESILKKRLSALHKLLRHFEKATNLLSDANYRTSCLFERLNGCEDADLLINFELIVLEELLNCFVDSGKSITDNVDKSEPQLMKWQNAVHQVTLLAQSIFETSLLDLQLLHTVLVGVEIKRKRNGQDQRCEMQLNKIILVSSLLRNFQVSIGFRNKDLPVSLFQLNQVWELFSKHWDFKKKETFNCLHDLLSNYAELVFERLFGFSGDCKLCLRGRLIIPVILSCKHFLCRECFEHMRQNGEKKCHECETHITDDVLAISTSRERSIIPKYKRFQEFSNSLIADISTRLIFTAANVRTGTIDDEVYTRLFSFATTSAGRQADQSVQQRTKQFTIFADCFDPNPVFRSFLLKLTLRAGGEQTLKFLEHYLQQANIALGDGAAHQNNELLTMIIHCIEDSYIERDNHHDPAFIESESQNLIWSTANSEGHGRGQSSTVRELQRAAFIRFMFEQIIDRLVPELVQSGMTVRDVKNSAVAHCLKYIRPVCEDVESYSNWLRFYFMRIVLRKHGIATLQALMDINEFKWLVAERFANDTVQAQAKAPDLFLVYDQRYVRIYEVWYEFLLKGDMDRLSDSLHNVNRNATEVAFLSKLVLMRFMSDAHVVAKWNGVVQKVGSAKLTALFVELTKNCDFMSRSEFFNAYANNVAATAAQAGSVALVVEHFGVVATVLANRGGFLLPFSQLALSPNDLRRQYLPSMPNDHLDNTLEALKTKEILRLYACPNGHPYMIGECGRPWTTSKCADCGLLIGGQRHVAADNNLAVDQPAPRKQDGHILGEARLRPTEPVPERQLSSTATCVLRLLTHLAMYTAAQQDNNLRSLRDLINIRSANVMDNTVQQIDVNGVKQFLLEHLTLDVRLLSSALGINQEEVYMFLHLLLRDMYDRPVADASNWTTERARDDFEVAFNKHYLAPLQQTLANELRQLQQRMLQSDQSGSKQLLMFLYEFDDRNDDAQLNKPCCNPAFWRYRQHITIDTFMQYAEVNRNKLSDARFKLMKHFINNINILEQLKHLPALLHVQTSMEEQCSRRWSVETGRTLKIDQFLLANGGVDVRLANSVRQFMQLWNTLRLQLAAFTYRGQRLPDEYHNVVLTGESSAEFLLASLKGAGICIVLLTAYLIEQHNRVLELYAAANGRNREQIGEVTVGTLTSAQTFSFDPQMDVLTKCILRNCTYTIDSSKRQHEADVSFEVGAVAEELEDRLISSRPFLEYKIPAVVYVESVTDRDMFVSLNRCVKQTELAEDACKAIRKEMARVAQVNEVISTLSLTMRLAITTRIDNSSELLVEFLSNMGTTTELWSGTLKITCTLAHLQSTYRLLSVHRACLMHDSGNKPFERASPRLGEPFVSEKDIRTLQDLLRTNRIDGWTMLVVFHDVVSWLSRTGTGGESNAEADNVDYPLKDLIEACLDSDDIITYDTTQLDYLRGQVQSLPSEIYVKHLIWCWTFINDFISGKPKLR